MQDMRDCYDSLLFAAAAKPNSAYGKHYSSHLFVNIAHVVSLYSSLIMYSKLLNWLCVFVLLCSSVPHICLQMFRSQIEHAHLHTHLYFFYLSYVMSQTIEDTSLHFQFP
ncbi:hypothetical protein AAZX31_10G106000 [Glycine max]